MSHLASQITQRSVFTCLLLGMKTMEIKSSGTAWEAGVGMCMFWAIVFNLQSGYVVSSPGGSNLHG